MRVQRQISWFSISSEELVGESSIDHVPLDDLKKLFDPPADDPLMYNPYEINIYQAKELRRWVRLIFDFDSFTYYAECFQA
ncbi:DUF7683 domain-containing protein [Spirosoma oryzae]|uniref:DUF7683 domain-containing protein n=1 Tax=Spirosoma oryzae TaxID=1469603 RepID=UPI003CCBAFCA